MLQPLAEGEQQSIAGLFDAFSVGLSGYQVRRVARTCVRVTLRYIVGRLWRQEQKSRKVSYLNLYAFILTEQLIEQRKILVFVA